VVLNENFVENKTLSHLGKQKDILERESVCVCVCVCGYLIPHLLSHKPSE